LVGGPALPVLARCGTTTTTGGSASLLAVGRRVGMRWFPLLGQQGRKKKKHTEKSMSSLLRLSRASVELAIFVWQYLLIICKPSLLATRTSQFNIHNQPTAATWHTLPWGIFLIFSLVFKLTSNCHRYMPPTPPHSPCEPGVFLTTSRRYTTATNPLARKRGRGLVPTTPAATSLPTHRLHPLSLANASWGRLLSAATSPPHHHHPLSLTSASWGFLFYFIFRSYHLIQS
jgi:hypothetical protein